MSKGIQKQRYMLQQACILNLNIGQQPDNCSGRYGNTHCPAQHEQRTVKDGTHDHLAKLRSPIRRKLQCKA